MQQEQCYKEVNAPLSQLNAAEMPQCCGTGCAVCVLDYPELFTQSLPNSETLAMIEAVEQAQLLANQLLAETDSELR